MYLFYLYLVFQAFLLALLTEYFLVNYLLVYNNLAEWVFLFMSKKMELIILFVILQIIFLSLHQVLKYAVNLLKYKKRRAAPFDYWKAVSLLIITFDIYLYLVLNIGWIFLISFISYWLMKEIAFTLPK